MKTRFALRSLFQQHAVSQTALDLLPCSLSSLPGCFFPHHLLLHLLAYASSSGSKCPCPPQQQVSPPPPSATARSLGTQQERCGRRDVPWFSCSRVVMALWMEVRGLFLTKGGS